MKKKGLFIVIDGPSASGKDSIIKQILKDLTGLKIKVLPIEETKEENYDREKILEAKGNGDREITRVIIDERKKLYQTKVIPQLMSGTLVIANRGEPTTLAYQTINQELTMESIWNIHRQEEIPISDLVVLTNCSVEEAIRREKLRRKSSEKENKKLLSGKFTPHHNGAGFTSRRQEIHANYEILKDFLEKKGISVIYLRTDTMNIAEESQRIVDFIKNKLDYSHE